VKTLEQIRDEWHFQCLDGRDLHRLADFIPEEMLEDFRVSLKPEYVGTHTALTLTRENVLAQLKEDVAFGFEKALDKRGISASLMWEVVRMWNWILEEGLENFTAYEMYGLPLFKATAIKYGFANPIADDEGTEDFYNESDYEDDY
jgi:hypothetical protein